ncbi:hypothetical protein MUO14_04020 [Halobacillus shinanisalinarum]|uniref:Uncharacterized protein n=1 Tax=Halobacillus shinanisalinarum TaxID=2932258 RepID=A0ABY4H3G6_9BACI|nr:hypothetical protein [Halobacillus shinanisalinarum]UOQ94142.1 hypothetical protein MUO14_04020 [Halobacillus shinanisalinarum]
MRKWLIIILGSVTVTVWSLVIVVFPPQPVDKLESKSHSQAVIPVFTERALSDHQLVSLTGGAGKTNGLAEDLVIETNMITKNWVEGLSEDGKISIDILLHALNLN